MRRRYKGSIQLCIIIGSSNPLSSQTIVRNASKALNIRQLSYSLFCCSHFPSYLYSFIFTHHISYHHIIIIHFSSVAKSYRLFSRTRSSHHHHTTLPSPSPPLRGSRALSNFHFPLFRTHHHYSFIIIHRHIISPSHIIGISSSSSAPLNNSIEKKEEERSVKV
jgi:hypothetical protein